jgi:hypothetical protein
MKAVDVSAGGAFLACGTANSGRLAGASLRAAAAAATLTIRETDGSGRILAVLAAAANASDHWTPGGDVHFQGNVHATVTGAAAVAIAYEG